MLTSFDPGSASAKLLLAPVSRSVKATKHKVSSNNDASVFIDPKERLSRIQFKSFNYSWWSDGKIMLYACVFIHRISSGQFGQFEYWQFTSGWHSSSSTVKKDGNAVVSKRCVFRPVHSSLTSVSMQQKTEHSRVNGILASALSRICCVCSERHMYRSSSVPCCEVTL